MGSLRFPGKMLQKLGRHSLIEWVMTRALDATSVDEVVLATSTKAENDPLEDCASQLGIATFRGDESDVLDRYVKAANRFKADHIIRICADNPFVAPEEVDRLIEVYATRRPDYAFNHVPRMSNNYPDGLGAEIFPRSVLEKLDRVAREQRYREHVTLYVWDHPNQFTISSFAAPSPIAYPAVKLDVDTEEDLRRLQNLPCVHDIHASAQTVVDNYRAQYGAVV